jgi:outer membrane protein
MRRRFRLLLVALFFCFLSFPSFSLSFASEMTFDLDSAVAFSLKNNPSLRSVQRNIESEKYGIDAAKAERFPRIDLGTGVTRYKFPTALTPIVITPPLTSLATELPDFEKTIYDGAASFRLALFRGGRIFRNIRIAETKKALAEDNYATAKQDLIYNVTSVYYKILQLQRLVASLEASLKQLEAHRANVDELLQAGSVPRLDLLKADTELAYGRNNLLMVRNNLDNAFELLKTLLGLDESGVHVSLSEPLAQVVALPAEEDAMKQALDHRPEYRALAKKRKIAEEQVKVATAKHLPEVYGSGEYSQRGGETTDLKENWYLGVRLTFPVFDGGLIRSEVNRNRVELEKTREEERVLRMSISREVKDARLTVVNATERIAVTERAIESAREAARIEHLRYQTGAGTSTDVLDAQTALLRAETDSYQAAYDRVVGLALLKKGLGLMMERQEASSRGD